MTRPTLYLMVGYPGAGKTTTSKILHRLTGAVHLWADKERHKRFQTPTYSPEENQLLYDQMNQETHDLLAKGQSVIFDTNFNYYKDRQLLSSMATGAGAATLLIWVSVPKSLAYTRATADTHKNDNGFLVTMSDRHFKRLTNNLEPPRSDEKFIAIDGTKVTPNYIHKKLKLE